MESKNNFQHSTFNSQLIRVAIVDDHKIVAAVPERLINETDVAHVIGIFATPSAEFIDKLLH